MHISHEALEKDVSHFIHHFGCNFLLSCDDIAIYCNDNNASQYELCNKIRPHLMGASLICSFKNAQQALQSLSELCSMQPSTIYTIPGILAVKSNDYLHIRLSGGSYSQTYITYQEQNWLVIKECEKYDHNDKDLRLIHEMEFIRHLPQDLRSLFPQVVLREDIENGVRYAMEYVPYNDFASVIYSGQYDAVHMFKLLEVIYEKLFASLYKKTLSKGPDEHINYADLAYGRLDATMGMLNESDHLKYLLEAEDLIINDQAYIGVRKTLRRASQFLSDKSMPHTYNHGDLIFQDILVDPTSMDFRLIDPNGQSSGYMYDFAKTLLCLETKYDFLYHGDFLINISKDEKKTPRVEIEVLQSKQSATVNTMNNLFWEYLQKNEERFFSDQENWQKTLLVLCGLQNIAIIMFHALHYKKHDRASAFLVSGIKTINDTLDGVVNI